MSLIKKISYKYLSFILICTGLLSCKKVIDLNLKNAGPVIVIDGGVSDINENQTVKISNTYSFIEPNKFNAVSGALVVLTVASGQKIVFTEVAAGIYQSRKFQGIPGNTYILDVTVDNKNYSATSIMPKKVKLDSLTFKQFIGFGETNTYFAVNYNDPPDEQNQYRFILKTKDMVKSDEVSEDRFNNGNKITEIINYALDDLKKGDKVGIEMQCIDRNVFKYFYTLNQISDNSSAQIAPSNPDSNFSNGALGIFNAHISSRQYITWK